MVKTRFAPSPTGLLHIGNARTALICFLFAKQHNGTFMLRLDDTDTERSKDKYTQAVYRDLEWLQLHWDETKKQSERTERYKEVVASLIEQGRLYPCYESAEEIEMKRKMLLGRGLPPIYDRSALQLTDSDKSRYESEGRKPHWRFKLDSSQTIQWQDLIKGPVSFDAAHLSDPVLIRENGSPTYMLPSTIDDMDFSITHVIRGEDHVSNTAIQIQLFEALGYQTPTFAHHSLMKTTKGKISKRDGGHDLQTLRNNHIEAMAINSYLARLGTSDPVEVRSEMDALIAQFNVERFSKAAAVYDEEEIKRLNAKLLHQYDYAHVKSRPEMSGIDETFWQSVRANLTTLEEIQLWWNICHEPITPITEDAEFLQTASTLLPKEPWDENTWSQWISEVKSKTDRKGKELFMPIRKALTAMEHGPELKYILPLIGYTKTHQRLLGNTA